MKVLHIGKYYPPFRGGMETYLGHLLPCLRQRGVDATALVHQHKSGDPSADYVHQVPSYGQVLYAPISPQFPFELSKIINAQKPDILHLHLPNTSAFWVLVVAKARKIPWVIHWHSDIDVNGNRRLAAAYLVYKRLEKQLLKKCEAIIVTSPPYLESSKTLQPWRNKCRVIPLGLDPSVFPQLSSSALNTAQKRWGQGKQRVLAVARMSYYKGLHHLINAVAETENLKLTVVGPGTRENIKHRPQNKDAIDNVDLVGELSTEDLHALMATCDCLCLPSIARTEAFGLVLLEAMHHSKPVIASDISGSGVTWVIEDGVTGKLVPPGDKLYLKQALETLQTQKSIWKTMGEKGQSRFQDTFDLRIIAGDIVKLYENLLDAKR